MHMLIDFLKLSLNYNMDQVHKQITSHTLTLSHSRGVGITGVS